MPSRNMFRPLILVAICVPFLLPTLSVAQEPVLMTNEKMGEQLREKFGDDRVEGRDGVWKIVLTEDNEEEEPDEELEELGDDDSSDAQPADEELGENELGNDEDSDDEELPGAGAEEQLPPIMVVLTDSRANRMRLMMPIRTLDPSKQEDLRLALIALTSNYDRALDARYALQQGVLWSVFIHPLESLTEDDLENAIDQVRTLRKNTGTTFTSSDLLFGGASPEEREEEQDAEDEPMNF